MRLYTAKRNYRSDPEAIRKLSKYGVAKVFEIGEDYLLEEFVDFENIKLGPAKLGQLLKKIHGESNEKGIPLIHGDFGEHNTTVIENESLCYDYEYARFGEKYSDTGRVILRDCPETIDVEEFFHHYSGRLPPMEELSEGLKYFCDLQNAYRIEKELPFADVPLIRKERLNKNKHLNLVSILDAFKSKVRLDENTFS
jgi:RIO-like serine/threonine protein kinase